jgi:DNA-binding MarR family transcriptional regulator
MTDHASRLTPVPRAGDQAGTASQGAHPDGAAREAWALLVGLFPDIRNNFFAACAEVDLTPAQGRLLHFLDPERPVPMAELACVHSCDASNITGLVDKLEARGLIARTPNPVDRRVRMITVTPAGAALRAKLLERISQPPSLISSLSPIEQRRLRDILRKATRTTS